LATQQLGVPLSKWVLWQAIRISAQSALSMSLAEAALAGGFADQAHFTRSARKLFGLTPTELLRAATT
jgi:AraC-like DNA-binding protein